jgi:hypothetical protein
VSDSSSSSEDSDTDPEDEVAQDTLQGPKEKKPVLKDDDQLFRHKRSGILHCGRAGVPGVFVCGRPLSQTCVTLLEFPVFEWPRCIECFKKRANQGSA